MTNNLDMNKIIFQAILKGKNMPLKMNASEKEKFAKDIADICEKHSFSKSRDDFKKEINRTIQIAISKYSGDD